MGAGCQSRLVGLFRRGMAVVCSAVVFALGLFAASPALHGQLHDHADRTVGDGCVVVLFASGVSMPLAATAPVPSTTDWHEYFPPASNEVYLDSPRYLLQPGRGPPSV